MQIHQETNGAHLQMIRKQGAFLDKLFLSLYYIQFLLITILACFLTIRSVVSGAHAHRFHPKEWYPPVLASTVCAGILGFTWQELDPSRIVKATFCLSPLLTCAFGVLLICIGTPGSFAACVVALISSIVQSLYACWVIPRFQHAERIVRVCTAYRPPKVRTVILLSLIICTAYSTVMVSGIGGAATAGRKLGPLFVVLILVSFTWTMQIAKNTLHTTISHVKYMQFMSRTEIDIRTTARNSAKYSMGSICIGSIIVPVIGAVTGLARAINLVSEDADEFMFSCANCCSGVAARLISYGNKWGFVQVGVYNKGIVQASMDTWEMFKRVGMEKLINSDLTSSFCFLCGVAAGSTCALVGGIWALLIHKPYATEVSLYTFLIGYCVTRVATARIQASVAAYYVAYAENPQCQQFDSTIPDYMWELQRLET